MSPSFKGIISLIISALFFFPWVWMAFLPIELSTLVALIVGLIMAGIAIFLGFQARSGGSKIWGTAGLTLGVISIILNVVNLFAVIISRT